MQTAYKKKQYFGRLGCQNTLCGRFRVGASGKNEVLAILPDAWAARSCCGADFVSERPGKTKEGPFQKNLKSIVPKLRA